MKWKIVNTYDMTCKWKGEKVCEERQLGVHGMDGEIIIHEIIVIVIGKEKKMILGTWLDFNLKFWRGMLSVSMNECQD